MGKMKGLPGGCRGFTLIEIVVVAGIMALFSLTLISVFLATVRGGTKAQLVQAAHQEGDLAIKVMAAAVRNGQAAGCNGSELTITTVSGSETVFALVEDDGRDRVASNSSQFLTGKLAEATDLTFSCYQGFLGNQVVTMSLTLAADLSGGGSGQAQEKWEQEFATSVSTRQY